MLAFRHSSVSVVCLTSVCVQTQVALVMPALDCDHAQPRTGHQIWSQASQVKSSVTQGTPHTWRKELLPFTASLSLASLHNTLLIRKFTMLTATFGDWPLQACLRWYLGSFLSHRYLFDSNSTFCHSCWSMLLASQPCTYSTVTAGGRGEGGR